MNFKFLQTTTFTLMLFLTLLLTNCKKDDVDFRDNIVGKYTNSNVSIVSGYKNYVTNLIQTLTLSDPSFAKLSDTINNTITSNILVTKLQSDASKVIIDYTSANLISPNDTLKIVGSTVSLSDYNSSRFANKDSSVQIFLNEKGVSINLILKYNSYTAIYSNNQFTLNGVIDFIIDVKSSTYNKIPLGRTNLTANVTSIFTKQ